MNSGTFKIFQMCKKIGECLYLTIESGIDQTKVGNPEMLSNTSTPYSSRTKGGRGVKLHGRAVRSGGCKGQRTWKTTLIMQPLELTLAD